MKASRSLFIRTTLLALSVLLFALASLAQSSAVRARVTQAVDMQNLVTLRGNVHPLARPELDQGVAPEDLPLGRILLVLQRGAEQEAVLRQLLDDQQVKSSSRFHQWLTPEQFGRQFGPADSDLHAVTDWLALQGFEVSKVSAGRTVIEFSGTAGEVRQALGTEIHKFRVDGQDYWANASDPRIPAALAPVVAGFASLNNFPRQRGKRAIKTFLHPQDTGGGGPSITLSENGVNYYGVVPMDFATIYNLLPLWNNGVDGTGQTVAVVSDSNIRLLDVDEFRSAFGLPATGPQIILDGPDPGINGDEVEADIDVEWAGAVAKNATIDLVVSETTESTWGIDLSALYIIDNNLAPVMSVSYGACEQYLGVGGNAFYSATREQGAAQGITIVSSSGDSGSARCDQSDTEISAENGLAVSGLASTPFDVAVGGTDFGDVNNWSQYWNSTNNSTTFSSAKSYIPETAWNGSCAASGNLNGCASAATYSPVGIAHLAGGGGPSTCGILTGADPNATCVGGYPKPDWQTGTGVPQDGVRDIPDVSLFASSGANSSFYVFCEADALPTSYVSCQPEAGTWYFVGGGGTSFAAPDFAGIMALVNQKTGQRQGNANYVLYPLAAKAGATCTSNAAAVSNSKCIFYDVVSGNNSVACQGGSRDCSDQSTGGYGILVNPANTPAPAWTTTAGYDLVTGLGSVNAANLVNNWTSVSFQPTTTTLSSFPTTITHGQPVSFSVSVTSGSGTPTGDVSLLAQMSSTQNVAIGSFGLGSAGSLAGTTDMLPGGSYSVVAHYAGDGIHGSSDSAPQPVTVGRESSQTILGVATCTTTGACTYGVTNMVYGSAITLLRMGVTNSTGQPCASPTTSLITYPCPTGTVMATVNGQPPWDYPNGFGSEFYTLNSQGYAEDQRIQLPGGADQIVASYTGDNSYTGSTSPTVPVTVTKASTTITFQGLPSSILGSNIMFYADIATQSIGAFPTGSVQLLNNGVAVGSPVVINAGNPGAAGGAYANAQVPLSGPLPVGTNNLSAQYSGDTNYSGSTSAVAVVNNADFGLSVNPNPINISAPGGSGTSTLTITTGGLPATTIGLSCVTEYIGTNCTLSPPGYNTSGSTVLTATIAITTTGPASAARPYRQAIVPPSHQPPFGWPWLLAGFLVVATLVSLAATGRSRITLLLGVTLLVAGAWAACGGGGGGGGSSLPPPAPTITLSPSTLSFNSPSVGATSFAQTVTLYNGGTAGLNLSSIALSGANATDFAQTNNCGATLDVANHCAIGVTFTPAATGTRSAALTITDNASNSPQSVSLTGSVEAMPFPTLSPTSLSFGQVNDGAVTPAQTVTLANVGSALLSISSIGIQGANFFDYVQTNNCGASLAAGANCAINVQFKPASYGYTSIASLAVVDNAPGSPQTASLTGTGLPPVTPVGTFWVRITAEGEGGSGAEFQEWFHDVQLTVNVQ